MIIVTILLMNLLFEKSNKKNENSAIRSNLTLS